MWGWPGTKWGLTTQGHWPLDRTVGARLVTAVCAVISLTSCDSPPDSLAVDVGVPTVLQAADLHVVGSSESIAVVEDLAVLPSGAVWVLNSVEPFFVGFGPEGTPLGEHGSRGGGPEEFRSPAGFVAGGIDDEAWVFDPRRHALIEISRLDEAWSEILLPRDSLPPGTLFGGMGMMSPRVRSARLGDEIVLARSFGSLGPGGVYTFWRSIWGADLFAVDPATASARPVVPLGEVLGDPTPYLQQTNGFPPFPLWLRLWAVCSDTEIRVHDRLRNEVRRFSEDGVELAPIELPSPHLTAVTDEQFARAIFGLRFAEVTGQAGAEGTAADSARVLKDLMQGIEGDPDQLAAFLPRYVDMRCDDDGAVWLRPIDIDRGELEGGLAWLRITTDGTAREYHLPERFDAHRFSAGRIWGVQRDDFDVASVAWIAMPRSR